LHHNVSVARHKREWKMTELIMRNYWWPEVTKNVGKHRWLQYILENEEQNKSTSREIKIEWNIKKAIDTSNSGLYH